MKRLSACLALILPLASAGAAGAKEVVAAKVCGASECRTVKDRAALRSLHEGGAPTGPPAPSAHYRVSVTVRADRQRETFPVVIMPRAGLVRGGSEAEGYTWMPVSDGAERAQRRMTRGLEPLPAAKLDGLDAPSATEARVDEVVLPPREAVADPEAADGAPVWPWLAGPLAALGVVAAVRRRGRRRR